MGTYQLNKKFQRSLSLLLLLSQPYNGQSWVQGFRMVTVQECSWCIPYRSYALPFSEKRIHLNGSFPSKMGYSVPHWPSFSAFSGRKPLRKSGTGRLWVGFSSHPQPGSVRALKGSQSTDPNQENYQLT